MPKAFFKQDRQIVLSVIITLFGQMQKQLISGVIIFLAHGGHSLAKRIWHIGCCRHDILRKESQTGDCGQNIKFQISHLSVFAPDRGPASGDLLSKTMPI